MSNAPTDLVDDWLSAQDRAELIAIPRRVMQLHFETGKRPHIESTREIFQTKAGAFVTLHIGKALRGCIGTFDPRDALIDTVVRMTIAAATSDPRFAALEREELPHVTFEISVLSPLRKTDAADVVVGKHGVEISRGPLRGVLLPQVATEYGWDRETFLIQTCRKAGLPQDAWRDPQTSIQTFTAQVFSEGNHA